MHVRARQRGAHFGMLSNESFDDFKITFLNRYGTAFHDSAVCHVEGRFDAQKFNVEMLLPVIQKQSKIDRSDHT